MTLATFALVFAIAAPEQGAAPATIYGRVQDRDGHPLAGATLALKKTTSLAVTDDQGNFVLSIPPGMRPPFAVSAVLPGYVSATVDSPAAGGLGAPLGHVLESYRCKPSDNRMRMGFPIANPRIEGGRRPVNSP